MSLPDLEEDFLDTAWSRNLGRLGLPRAPAPIGWALVITHRIRCVIHVADNEKLHSRIDLVFFAPRGEFEGPAHRGVPVSSTVAVYPREMLPPSDWTGVSVDPRDPGQLFDFQVHSRQDLSPAEIADALDCEIPMEGYDDHATTPGRYVCRPSCCLDLG